MSVFPVDAVSLPHTAFFSSLPLVSFLVLSLFPFPPLFLSPSFQVSPSLSFKMVGDRRRRSSVLGGPSPELSHTSTPTTQSRKLPSCSPSQVGGASRRLWLCPGSGTHPCVPSHRRGRVGGVPCGLGVCRATKAVMKSWLSRLCPALSLSLSPERSLSGHCRQPIPTSLLSTGGNPALIKSKWFVLIDH